MDAIDFLIGKYRMCHEVELCSECPLGLENNTTHQSCDEFITGHPEEAVEIMEKWLDEHQPKSRLDDLLEKYPNVELFVGRTPKICCASLGYCDPCDNDTYDCFKCWHEPVEIQGEKNE